MKRLALVVALTACGPAVAVDGGSDTTSTSGVPEPETTSTLTSGGTSVGTAATTAPSDEATSIDPTAGEATATADESGEVETTAASTPFIIEPDGGSDDGGCDAWSQDCPRDDKCMPWANDGGVVWNATRCSPIAGDPAEPGEACLATASAVSGIDDCGLGTMCWAVDPVSLEGECVAMCGGTEANPECADGETCVIAYDGVLVVCLPSCDPLLGSCAADEACVSIAGSLYDAQFTCAPTVQFPPLGHGEACEQYGLAQCGDGTICVEAEHVPGCVEASCCTTLGDLADSPSCPDPTQSCLPLYADGEAPAGLEDLCFCGLPE